MKFLRHNRKDKHGDSEANQDNLSLKTHKIKHIESQPDQSAENLYEKESSQTKVRIRIAVFAACLLFLFLGRFSVPEEVTYECIDRVQDLFLGVNEFLMKNDFWRNTLQIICSLFMDIMFLATGIHWIIRGGTSRLVVTTISFYLIRAMVQAVWVSPFPKEGYWWYDPGLPSLVVPYGRGTDFFFSGHIGFVTICASEWKKNGNKLMTTILAIGGVYTGFILLAYKIHYSIDLFTGVTFAHWLFMIVDQNIEKIDNFLIRIYYSGKDFAARRSYTPYRGKADIEQNLYDTMKG